MQGEQDAPAPHLHNQHLHRMENGAHPFPGVPAHDPLIAQARQAMNELAGVRIPPMQHGLEDNQAVAAHQQGNQHQDGGIRAVLPQIGNVTGQVLQAHTARPSIARPAALNSVRSITVEAQPSNIGSLYCHYCWTLNSNAANVEGNAYACGHCCKDNHTDDQCSIEAVRVRQKESQRDHVGAGSDDECRSDSPYPGVKKTVKFKPSTGRNDQNQGSPSRERDGNDGRRPGSSTVPSDGCLYCRRDHYARDCPIAPMIRSLVEALLQGGTPVSAAAAAFQPCYPMQSSSSSGLGTCSPTFSPCCTSAAVSPYTRTSTVFLPYTLKFQASTASTTLNKSVYLAWE
eukprot:82966-Rhodomonas_salina.3